MEFYSRKVIDVINFLQPPPQFLPVKGVLETLREKGVTWSREPRYILVSWSPLVANKQIKFVGNFDTSWANLNADQQEALPFVLGLVKTIETEPILTTVAEHTMHEFASEAAERLQPPMYRLKFNDWGWVKLHELAAVLSLTPAEILGRFGAFGQIPYGERVRLSYSYGDSLHTVNVKEMAALMRELESSMPPVVYITAKSSTKIVIASKLGYKEVVAHKYHLKYKDSKKLQANWLSIDPIPDEPEHYWVLIGVGNR